MLVPEFKKRHKWAIKSGIYQTREDPEPKIPYPISLMRLSKELKAETLVKHLN